MVDKSNDKSGVLPRFCRLKNITAAGFQPVVSHDVSFQLT
jgi:hypothetical protein